MDYVPAAKAREAIELKKYQWDLIHDPENIWFAWMEKEEEVEIKKLQGTYTIWVGDSVVKDKKVLINTNKKNKIFVKYEPVAGGTGTFIYSKVVYRPEWSKEDKSWPVTTWGKIDVNTKTYFPLDSLPEGKYMVLLKNKKEQIDTVKFYLRNKKYDFACEVCGRDLTIRLDKMQQIFSGNKNLTEEDAKLFNEALKKGGFNTCRKQAHFFAQVKTETENYTKFKEDLNYSLVRVLKTWPKSKNIKMFFNQSFWDKKDYLKYFWYQVYEVVDTAKKAKGKYDAGTIEKFTWQGEGAEAGDTIKFPVEFIRNKKDSGIYNKVTFTTTQQEENARRLFSQIYQYVNGNGAASTFDGYTYVGRGAIHLTGRLNYRYVSDTCNNRFKTSYNWESNPQQLESDNKARIYSAVSFFLYRLKGNLKLLETEDVEYVTKMVNGGSNALDKRKTNYDNLRQEIFNCK